MNVFKSAQQACATDIAETLGLKGRRTSPYKGVYCCPFHDDKTPSMTTYPNRNGRHGGFYCFGCHAHGDATDLWAQVKGVSNLRAARDICNALGYSYDDYSFCDSRERREANPDAEKIMEVARYWHEYRLAWYKSQLEGVKEWLNSHDASDRFWSLEAQVAAQYNDTINRLEHLTDADILRDTRQELEETIGGPVRRVPIVGACA